MSRPQLHCPQPPAQSNTRLIVVIVLVLVIVAGVIGAIVASSLYSLASSRSSTARLPQSDIIFSGVIIISSAGYHQYKFIVPAGATSASVNGSFTASGTIEVFVMDQTNFINWQNNARSSSYYDSGPVTHGTISAWPRGSGTYDLVYLDPSPFFTSSKNVETTVYLYYLA